MANNSAQNSIKHFDSALKLLIDLPDAKGNHCQNYRIRDERKLFCPRKIISDTFYSILRLWVWSSIADMTGIVNPSISLTGSARKIFFKAYSVIINYFYIHSPWPEQLFQRVSQVLWEPDIKCFCFVNVCLFIVPLIFKENLLGVCLSAGLSVSTCVSSNFFSFFHRFCLEC